jgi:hypothetical protein
MQIGQATLDDLTAIQAFWTETAIFHQEVGPYFSTLLKRRPTTKLM